MTYTCEILAEGSETELETFLKVHTRTAMFQRSNLARGGIRYAGKSYQGDYFAMRDDAGTIVATLAHFWNGYVSVAVPDLTLLDSFIPFFKDNVTRKIAGFSGDDEQVKSVVKAVGMNAGPFALNSSEGLYWLDLDHLKMPANASKNARIISAKDATAETLFTWMKAYDIEGLGNEEGPALDARIADSVATMKRDGMNRWVLLVDNHPVSLCGFNARLPEIVQVGPVWTPPENRSKGYARLGLALALAQARAQGVRESLLFTDNPAAVKSYISLGYELCGSFRLALFKNPTTLSKG